jgi:peptidoglycan/LPS O-acetylase OafA/YrhL
MGGSHDVVRAACEMPAVVDPTTLESSSSSAGLTRLEYRGRVLGLDGLRGVAILMVLVAHFNQEALLKQCHPWLGPLVTKLALTGLSGVELFFVLSGFLITGILLDSQGKGRYFFNFYGRRFLRIFPLYYGSLVFVFGILPFFWSYDEAARKIASQQWRLWLYVTNVPGGPGWDGSEIFKLGHFWSLAVEEHFYLLWPLVIHLVHRQKLPAVCVGLIGLGTVARVLNVITGGTVALLQWSTVCKIDGLAVGALLAILVRREEWHRKLAALARKGAPALGVLFVMMGCIPRAVPEGVRTMISEPTAVALFASLLILSIPTKPSALANIMRLPLLVSFGKYSYGLYVIHGMLRPALLRWFPPAQFAEVVPLPLLGLTLQMMVSIAICYALAYGSWHLYEQHFLKLKKYFESTEPLLIRPVSVTTP